MFDDTPVKPNEEFEDVVEHSMKYDTFWSVFIRFLVDMHRRIFWDIYVMTIFCGKDVTYL